MKQTPKSFFTKICRKFVFFLILLLFLAALPCTRISAQEATDQEVLTNAAIVKMVQAHLGVDVIVEHIHSSPGKYSLTSSSLIALKQHGVPDKVIAAMQASKAGASSHLADKQYWWTPPSPRPENPSSASTKTADGIWKLDTANDVISGTSQHRATMSHKIVGPSADGELQVVATCDVSKVSFEIAFFSATNPQMGLKHSDYGYGPVPGGLIGAFVRHRRPWVEYRIRIDNDAPITVTSEDDAINVESFRFMGTGSDDMTKASYGSPKDPGLDAINMLKVLGAAGTIDTVFSARTILVESTLENGAKVILEIKPQEPSFREFASRCPRAPVVPATVAAAPVHTPTLAEIIGDGPTEDGFVMAAEQHFSGSMRDFIAALPQAIDKAFGTAKGSANHQKEISFIADAAKLCAGITPQMAASVRFDEHGNVDKFNGQPQLEKLGNQYKVCGPGSMAWNGTFDANTGDLFKFTPPYPAKRELAVSLEHAPFEWGGLPRVPNTSQGMRVYVYATRLESDPTDPRRSLFPILIADINH